MSRRRLYAKGTFTGNYRPQGNIENVDCVIGCEFAAPAGEFWGLANEDLAAFIARKGLGSYVPLMLNHHISRAYQNKFGGHKPALEFAGPSSTLTKINVGTKGELTQAKEFMEERGLESPLIVAQAHHVGRVVAQAEALGLEPVVLPHLPDRFDPSSEQPWTHGPVPWALHEAIGVPFLHVTGKF